VDDLTRSRGDARPDPRSLRPAARAGGASPPGTLFGGRVRSVALLGRDGTGEVYGNERFSAGPAPLIVYLG